jgi:hypothetical protein
MRLTAIICFFCLLVVAAMAQPVVISGPQGYGADSPYNQLYSTRSVFTFKGKVVGKEVSPPMKGMGNAVTLLVKSSDTAKTWHVDVGPEWYIVNQITDIKVGDAVQITGSRVKIDGNDVVLASQIVKGKAVLALRRPMGRPYWDAVVSVDPVTGDNVRTFSGQIVGMDTFIDGTNGATQRLRIRTEEGDIFVALAPNWFMERQALQLSVGNGINVYTFAPWGVPVNPGVQSSGNPPIVFASSIGFGQQWMTLRSVNGRPMWLGN